MTTDWKTDIDMLQCQIQDLKAYVEQSREVALKRLDELEAKLCELQFKKMNSKQSLDGIVEAALSGAKVDTIVTITHTLVWSVDFGCFTLDGVTWKFEPHTYEAATPWITLALSRFPAADLVNISGTGAAEEMVCTVEEYLTRWLDVVAPTWKPTKLLPSDVIGYDVEYQDKEFN